MKFSILSGENVFYLDEKKKGYKNIEGKGRGNLYSHIYDYTEDAKGPVIYTIHIAERGGEVQKVYVGKAKNGTDRPLKTYEKCVDNFRNNVQRKRYKRLEDGTWTVKKMINSWRKHVHEPLAQAKDDGLIISLTLHNCELDNIDVAEKEAIKAALIKYGDKVMNKADVAALTREIEKEMQD